MSKDISLAMAEFFHDQCCGESTGHMAMIPNSPVLYGIAAAHEVKTKEDFAVFIREVADWLDGGGHA